MSSPASGRWTDLAHEWATPRGSRTTCSRRTRWCEGMWRSTKKYDGCFDESISTTSWPASAAASGRWPCTAGRARRQAASSAARNAWPARRGAIRNGMSRLRSTVCCHGSTCGLVELVPPPKARWLTAIQNGHDGTACHNRTARRVAVRAPTGAPSRPARRSWATSRWTVRATWCRCGRRRRCRRSGSRHAPQQDPLTRTGAGRSPAVRLVDQLAEPSTRPRSRADARRHRPRCVGVARSNSSIKPGEIVGMSIWPSAAAARCTASDGRRRARHAMDRGRSRSGGDRSAPPARWCRARRGRPRRRRPASVPPVRRRPRTRRSRDRRAQLWHHVARRHRAR